MTSTSQLTQLYAYTVTVLTVWLYLTRVRNGSIVHISTFLVVAKNLKRSPESGQRLLSQSQILISANCQNLNSANETVRFAKLRWASTVPERAQTINFQDS